jgi:hypothetical protein
MLSRVKTKKQSSDSDHYFPEVITRVLVIKLCNMWHSSTVVGNEDVKIFTDSAPNFGFWSNPASGMDICYVFFVVSVLTFNLQSCDP